MLKFNRWTAPCGCVVDYQWDTTTPDVARTHTVTAHQPCADHAKVPNGTVHAANGDVPANHVLTALVECQQASRAQAIVADALGLDHASVGTKYDKNRQLTVMVPGLTAGQKTTAQNALASNGKNNVTVANG